MFVLKCKNTVFCDVDDTLFMWNASAEQLEKNGISVSAPAGVWLNSEGIEVACPAYTQLLLPHRKHIEQLKKHRIRGHTIIVWSAGGYDWAEAAVRALGLEDTVDLVISKPIWCYDDLQPNEYMPKSQWMKDE
jgi:hypothetical protein